MLPCAALLAVSLSQAAPLASVVEIPDQSPVHLGIALRLNGTADLPGFLQRLQDPASPDYHRWLTPQQFGERFGEPAAVYEKAARWLEAAGFTVTRFPNRTFLEAQGTSQLVRHSLAVHLQAVDGRPPSVHSPDQRPTFPGFLDKEVVHVAGLDTRIHFKHRLQASGGQLSFGPQDLRRFYNSQPLLDQGFVGQGQTLAVLSTAETPENAPSPLAIEYFLRNISDSSASFIQDVIPNPANDFDTEPGGGTEFALDVEMQSVGAPGADSITLVVSPSSEVFSTGVNYIVNQLSTVTAVSVSLGSCEPIVQTYEGSLVSAFRQSLQQGVAEGQTWSAASGDNGSDDCQNGQSEAVDFPASIPEMVAIGGSEVSSPNWDPAGALSSYQTETAWNDSPNGGAGGGGFSILYATPSYQQGLSLPGNGRSVPDIALIAGLPGVFLDNPLPGALSQVDGTSVGSPLSAGFFALVASRVGCRLGDVHSVLYGLGAGQVDGGLGVEVYNDIVTGSNSTDGVSGETAGPGYDSVTGWGSLNLQQLAYAWPSCDGGAGLPGPAYDPCEILACGGSAVCETLTEGPSSCVVDCDPNNPAGCSAGTLCSQLTLFAGDGGVCVDGCRQDSDCADAGEACNSCLGSCVARGPVGVAIGDACQDSSQCPAGGSCSDQREFGDGGYCTAPCEQGAGQGAACSCPEGSFCGQIGIFNGGDECVASCPVPGEPCARAGFLCQPLSPGVNGCFPPCQILDFNGGGLDICIGYGSSFSCDVTSGFCSVGDVLDAGPADAGGLDSGFIAPDAGFDAGTDGGPPSSGIADSGPGPVPDGGGSAGAGSLSSGCGYSSGAAGPNALWSLVMVAALALRRRKAASS